MSMQIVVIKVCYTVLNHPAQDVPNRIEGEPTWSHPSIQKINRIAQFAPVWCWFRLHPHPPSQTHTQKEKKIEREALRRPLVPSQPLSFLFKKSKHNPKMPDFINFTLDQSSN